MKTHTLRSEIWLPRQPGDVFPFFADARNLQRITPPRLRFEVVTPGEITMKTGTLIDYRLRVRGLPIRWQSEITAWEPPFRFADEQRRGPYRLWVHEHRFMEKDGGTLCIDDVRYAVPGGSIVNALFVGRDVRTIFEFRARALKAIFAAR
jgi:ligand-binding SRPBCC domain-containing protein